jgi:O-antigen/teichoic acid export membrane protein
MIKKIKSILFENTSAKQIVIKNWFRLTLSEFVSRAFTFLISIWVARSLWVLEFGTFNFVMTYVTFFVIAVDFWLSSLTFRELSKNPADIKKYFSNTILLKILLSIVWLFFVVLSSKFISALDQYLSLITIFFVYSIINNLSEFIRVFFRPIERMQNEAYLRIFSWLVLFLTTICFLFYSPDLKHLFLWFLTAWVINLIISFFVVIKFFKIQNFDFDTKFLYKITKMSIPFFLWWVFAYFYSDINIVLLKFFKWEREVWLFSAPYKLIGYVYVIFNIISLAMFRQLVQASKDKIYFKSIIKKFSKYHFVISIIFALLIFVFSKYIIILVYWSDYLSADMLLKLLAIIIIFKSFSYVYGVWLTALSKEYVRLWIQLSIAIINVCLIMFFVPKYWYIWMAYSLAISEIILFLSYKIVIQRFLS